MSLLLSSRITMAAKLDRLESIVRRVGERVGWPQAWLQEFIAYRGDPRMTLEEFYVRFTLKRMAAEPKLAAVKTEADALAFYRDEDYMLWRNLVHRRHSAWRRVLVTMRGREGHLLEMGAGIAPVSTWTAQHKPNWSFALVDLESAHRAYGLWRVKQYADAWAIPKIPDAARSFDVVTALDVFEHLAKPVHVAYECARVLRPGGYLHVNFIGNERQNDLDLSTVEQREATLAYLDSALDLVWANDGYTVRRKP